MGEGREQCELVSSRQGECYGAQPRILTLPLPLPFPLSLRWTCPFSKWIVSPSETSVWVGPSASRLRRLSAEAVSRSLVNVRRKKAMLGRINFISAVCDGRGKGKIRKY